MKDIKQYIDRVLGSSIRCLLPSYWWKRIFGLIVDEVEDVRKVANSKANKSVVDDVKGVSLRVDEVSTKVDEVSERVEEAVPHILYAPITTLKEEQIAHNAAVLRSLGAINKPYMIEVYYVSGLVLYKVAVNGVTKENNVLTVIASHPLDATSPFAIQMKLQFSADGSCVAEPLRPDAELSAGSLSAVQNKVVTEALATKQDAITDLATIRSGAAKGATALQSIPSEYVTETELTAKGYATISALNNKVDKVSGKQLSTEDFTSALKTKLEGLSNYDDTTLANAISGLETRLDTLVSGDASAAIESFNEITAFLDGVKDTQDLQGIIAAIEQQIASKQDKINDLDAIRSGAAKGATAIQSVKTINGQSIIGEGDITIEADVDTSAFATKEELNALQTEVINNEEVTAYALVSIDNRVNVINSALVDNEEITASALTKLDKRLSDLEAKLAELINTL